MARLDATPLDQSVSQQEKLLGLGILSLRYSAFVAYHQLCTTTGAGRERPYLLFAMKVLGCPALHSFFVVFLDVLFCISFLFCTVL
jgi:hypothetical protein